MHATTTVLLIAALAASGCARAPDARVPPPPPDPATTADADAPPATVAPPPRSVTATPASLDTVSEAQKASARARAAAAADDAVLGTATVTLGDPTDPGLWVKTALVDSDAPGTVRTGTGAAVAVTLRPLGGAGGAQISLSALQALGLPLAGLHQVTLARSP